MQQVKQVTPLYEYILKIWFADGSEKIVDLEPFIGKGISADLRNEDFFRQVAIDNSGGIYWPNGYDFCPNFLHDEVPEVDMSPA